MNPTLRNYVLVTLLVALAIIVSATLAARYLNAQNGPPRYESAFFLSRPTSATLCV
jgi:hypothetical protein